MRVNQVETLLFCTETGVDSVDAACSEENNANVKVVSPKNQPGKTGMS